MDGTPQDTSDEESAVICKYSMKLVSMCLHLERFFIHIDRVVEA